MPEAHEVPHEKKLLRWTSAILDKRNRIKEYLAEGTISEKDCVVIAVSSCRLQNWAVDDLGISRLPYAVEATFPIGPLAIPLNRQGQQDGPAKNIWRGTIRKPNSSEIPTGNFLDPGFNMISAVAGTHQGNLWYGPLQLSLVHNPLATAPVPKKMLRAEREYDCELGESDFTLRILAQGESLRPA